MTHPKWVFNAPLVLALAFIGHLINVLVWEPSLGFSAPADYYDADKLLAVIGHPVWLLGGLYHLLAGAAVLVLVTHQTSTEDSILKVYVSWMGMAACFLFALVSLTNLVGLREFGAIAGSTSGDTQAINGGFLIFRTILLNGAILFLGFLLLIGNGARLIMGSQHMAARHLGIATGLVALLMIFVPEAAPALILLLIVWGILSRALMFFANKN